MSTASNPSAIVYVVSLVIKERGKHGCEYSFVAGACQEMYLAKNLASKILKNDDSILRAFISKCELNEEWTIDETGDDTLIIQVHNRV